MKKIAYQITLFLIAIIQLAVGGIAKAETKQPKDLRIAIVGAGVAGLSAAYFLKDAGYENVTVYEKEPQVGGKVHSFTYDGHTHELGAMWIEDYYLIIYGLAAKYGIDLQLEEADFIIRDPNNMNYKNAQDYIVAKYGLAKTQLALANFQKVQWKFKSLNNTGFAGADPELFMTFDKFAVKYQIEPIAYGFKTMWTNGGFGYYHEVPSLYVLKYLMLTMRDPGTFVVTFQRVPDGYQRLWEKIADDLDDVRLNHTVEKVKRHSDGNSVSIEVTANGVTETFDRIIITCDLKESLKFLDATKDEQELFSQVKSYNFDVHFFHAHGISYSNGNLVVLAANNVPEKNGHVLALLNREESPGIWKSYQMAPWGTPSDELIRFVEEDVKQLGGQVESIIIQKQWSFFPHVKTQTLYNGFYDRIEASQGENGTYYAGGIMCLEGTERVCRYSEKLIRTYF
ncbi:MAG: FAD-dependent oxidoreductase [bacterium]